MVKGKETMTSRERVLRTFNHEKADRTPFGYSTNPGNQERLLNHYGLKNDEHEKLLKILGVDLRAVGASYTGPRLHAEIPNPYDDPKKLIHVDPMLGYHLRYVENNSGGYWDYCDFPLMEADEETVANWPLPNPDDYDYSQVADACKQHDEYALYVHCYGDYINGNTMLRSMEQTLVDLITDDPAGLLLAERRFEYQLKVCERILDAAKGRIDFAWLGEDLGTQDSPIISLDLFRKHILPQHKKLADMVHSYGANVMMHTCGSSSWAYEDFISIGINAVDTLQPECKDMDPATLVNRFGTRLAFHGCISTAGPLAFGTPQDVEKNIIETLEIMKPCYGYMLAPTHMIQDNTPLENVLTMYETARKYGFYD